MKPETKNIYTVNKVLINLRESLKFGNIFALAMYSVSFLLLSNFYLNLSVLQDLMFTRRCECRCWSSGLYCVAFCLYASIRRDVTSVTLHSFMFFLYFR